jgi:FkbM family methyltransferase
VPKTGGDAGVSAKERIFHAMTRLEFIRSAYGALRGISIVGLGIQKLVHAAMPLGTKMWMRIPEGLGKDLWIYADPRFEQGYTNGDHEPWVQELLKSELRHSDCYFDVGAHTGFFCLIASRFVGPSGKILAIEPDPDNFVTLKANMAKNGITQITIEEAAAWSSVGQVIFERAPDISNRTQGHIASAADPRLTRINVPAVRLDDIVFSEGYSAPDLIKMDVEGSEWDALQGAERLLNETHPKLLCEIHDLHDMDRIGSYLKRFGYAVEEWKPAHPRYSDYSQLYLWATADTASTPIPTTMKKPPNSKIF